MAKRKGGFKVKGRPEKMEHHKSKGHKSRSRKRR
jgi:hypothetical protein